MNNNRPASNRSLKTRLFAFVLALILSFGCLSGFTEVFAVDYGETLFSDNSKALDLYEEMKEFIQDVAENGGSTTFTYTCNYTATGTTSSVYTAAYNAYQVSDVFYCLLSDCPYDFYWMDKTTGVSISRSASTSNGKVTIKSFTFKFYVSDDYKGSNSYTVSTSAAAAASEAKEAAVAIVEKYASVTDVEKKLTAYKEEICALASYDYSVTIGDDYGNAYQLLYVFDGDSSTKVVCEGYAKAFQYLCDLTWPYNDPVICYTVTGTLTGGTGSGTHMWNIVQIDGESYLCDLTNSDSLTVGSDGELFLADASSATASSGSGYTFVVDSTTLKYVYSSNTLSLFTSDILTLTDGSKSLSNATVTLSASSYTYNGAARTPTVTVKLNGTTLTKNTDYTVAYSNNTNAGTATVTVTGKGSYTGTVTKTFTIIAKSIASATVTLSATSYTYSGSAKKPTPTVKLTLNGSTKTLTKGTDYTVTYSNNTDAGTATVTITGTGNYKGTRTKTFTINAKSIASGTATLAATSYTYSGSSIKPSVTLKVSSKTLTSGTDYTVSYSNNNAIGIATVTLTGTGNYTGTLTSTFTIKPAQVTISSAASTITKRLTVKWTKLSGTPSYQIAYKKTTDSSWTYVTVGSSTSSKTISGLTSGCYYYVSVRAYKTVSGTTYYGSWATTKKVYVK